MSRASDRYSRVVGVSPLRDSRVIRATIKRRRRRFFFCFFFLHLRCYVAYCTWMAVASRPRRWRRTGAAPGPCPPQDISRPGGMRFCPGVCASPETSLRLMKGFLDIMSSVGVFEKNEDGGAGGGSSAAAWPKHFVRAKVTPGHLVAVHRQEITLILFLVLLRISIIDALFTFYLLPGPFYIFLLAVIYSPIRRFFFLFCVCLFRC